MEAFAAVRSGQDCLGENGLKIWGLIPLCNKVSSKETGGALYVFQHPNMGKGGPPRHVHFNQDEWFYVLGGEFAMEVGDQKLRLYPGDSIFAPRRIPHAWAQICDSGGTLMTAVTPAGTFEEFLRETTQRATFPTPEEMARAFAAHDMQVLGPPLAV